MTLISAGAAGRRARGRAGLARPQEHANDPPVRPVDAREFDRRGVGFGGTVSADLVYSDGPRNGLLLRVPLVARVTIVAGFRAFSVLPAN